MTSGPEVLLRLPPGPGTRTARLAGALREAIRTGRLTPGARVPATRALAHDLGLSRGVVVEAYDQLIAEGLLTARRGAGTTVSAAMAIPAPPHPHVVKPRAEAVGGVPGGPAGGLDGAGMGWPGQHTVAAPLRPGVPDLAAFPRSAWLRAYRTALAEVPHATLSYGDPAGLAPLRAALATYASRVRAARCAPDDVIVTGGVAQGLALLAQVLTARGENLVAVEDPGSPHTRGQLAAHGLTPVPVPVDADGLVTGALPDARLGAVLVTPAHQYPTGVVLAPARRAELLAWARARDVLVIEDDYDAEFRYDREPVACLQGSGPDVVALASSVSKTLAPGLRLGWLVVPPAFRAEVTEAKFRADLGEPALDQLAFAELLRSGSYDRHLRRARLRYRRRRDALTTALTSRLPGATVTGIAAGLHCVLEMKPETDEAALVAAAHGAGLGPHGLTAARVASSGPPGLVLGYAAHPAPVLVDAARRLAALILGNPRVTR